MTIFPKGYNIILWISVGMGDTYAVEEALA